MTTVSLETAQRLHELGLEHNRMAGGDFFPCRTFPCPYEEETVEIGEGDAGEGVEPIVVRKLVPYLETP